MINEVTCCWGDPDDVMYTIDGEDGIRELNFREHGYVFGIWDDTFVQGSDEDDTAGLMHDEFLLYYIYYNGWPKRDIVPLKDIDEDAWDYDVAKNIPVEYDSYSYYDDDENVLSEYKMTYGDLLEKLGSPRARGRVLVDHNNGWLEFIAFWSEPSTEEKKLISKYVNNPYVVVFNNINEAKEFYLYEGNKVFTLKEWIQSGKYIPRIKKDEEAFALHNMKAKDKWSNTVTFRDIRNAKNAKKLGNMTMAQYNSLINQESIKKTNNMINEADITRKFRNLVSTSQLVKKISQHGYNGNYTEQAIYMLLKKYGIEPKTQRGGKSYFNKKNACTCIDRHIFELKELAEKLEAQYNYEEESQDGNVGYERNDMSVASRELLANDGVFGADENELYSDDENEYVDENKNISKKTIIISENKLNLFEVNYNWNAWKELEGGVKPKEKKATTTAVREKRPVVTNFYEARTVNQIGKTIRKAWDSQKLRAIAGYNRNITRMYGRNNADAVYNFFTNDNGNMFANFAIKYNTISSLTSDIERWAKEGDTGGVKYRLRDLPTNLEELAAMINELANKYKQLKKVRQFSTPLNKKENMVGNMIDGYKTSNGLSDLVIAKHPSNISAIVNQLIECAEYIRNKWGDNLNGSNR